jgi:hypothetical protein
MVWSGYLPANKQLRITNLNPDTGSLRGNPLPGRDVKLIIAPSAVRYTISADKRSITLTSPTPVKSLVVYWYLKTQ